MSKKIFWWEIGLFCLFIFALLATLVTNRYGVLYWMLDTRYSVWILVIFNAMLGLCFDFGIKTLTKNKKRLAVTRALHRLWNTDSLSSLFHPVKRLTRGIK